MTDGVFDVSAFAYAHRGLWGKGCTENLTGAFYSATAHGLGVELDVRMTRDQVPVVFHDATLQRMFGENRSVASMSAAELEAYRLADNLPVPTLDHALNLMGGLPVLIELKVDTPGDSHIADVVADALKDRSGLCAVMSFDEHTVARLCNLVEGRPVGLLIDTLEKLGAAGIELQAGKARIMGCDYIGPHHTSLAIAARSAGGLPLVTWTVRTEADLSLAREHSAAPIFEGISPALAKPSQTPI